MRALIVGGGIMGLCAARSLKEMGADVELFEQGEIPNPNGSSFDHTRLIRHVYGREAGYMRMVDAAYAEWDRIWHELGASLYSPLSTLALGHGKDDWAQASFETLRAAGRQARMVTRSEIESLCPVLEMPDGWSALYMETGGALHAARIVERLADLLERKAVRIHRRTRVRAIDPEAARLTLDGGGSATGDAIILAAGPWIGRLAPELAAALRPSRQVIAYLLPPAEHDAIWRRSPSILAIGHEAGFWIIPPASGRAIKTGDHTFSFAGDPAGDRMASETEAQAAAERCRGWLKETGAGYRLQEARACYYTVSEDERFHLAPFGARGWIMSPCSGHGFKFAPVLGRELARAIFGKIDAGDLTRWAAGGAN
jgi:glycine/D-amino acid oxidase-like deaminating enzyme